MRRFQKEDDDDDDAAGRGGTSQHVVTRTGNKPAHAAATDVPITFKDQVRSVVRSEASAADGCANNVSSSRDPTTTTTSSSSNNTGANRSYTTNDSASSNANAPHVVAAGPSFKDQVREQRSKGVRSAAGTTGHGKTNSSGPSYKDQVMRVNNSPRNTTTSASATKGGHGDDGPHFKDQARSTANNPLSSSPADHHHPSRLNQDASDTAAAAAAATAPVSAIVVNDELFDDSGGDYVTAERVKPMSKARILLLMLFLAVIVGGALVAAVVVVILQNDNGGGTSTAGGGNGDGGTAPIDTPPSSDNNPTPAPTLTAEASSPPPTVTPLTWIQLGQGVQIADSNDVTHTAVASSRNGLSFVLRAASSADIYTWQSEQQWQLVAQIPGDGYGATKQSVAMNDAATVVAIGSPAIDNPDAYSDQEYPVATINATGRVRIYEINATAISVDESAVPLGSDILIDDDIINAMENGSTEFGWSVDLSGDGTIVAIGARKQCLVRVYQYAPQEQDWFEMGQRIECKSNNNNNELYDDSFGTAVRLSANGHVLAIGEPGRYSPKDTAIDEGGNTGAPSMSGRVRVFRYNEATNEWDTMGQVLEGEAADDGFGTSLALSEDATILAVGSPGNDVGHDPIVSLDTEQDPALGSCRVFQYEESRKEWVQLGPDIDGEALFDFFGTAVSLSANGTVLAVGAPGSNDNGDDSGHVRILAYDAEPNAWNPVGSTIAGPFAFAQAGMSVALSASGDLVTIGMLTSDRHGMAQAFELRASLLYY